jgi:hypothetical protein
MDYNGLKRVHLQSLSMPRNSLHQDGYRVVYFYARTAVKAQRHLLRGSTFDQTATSTHTLVSRVARRLTAVRHVVVRNRSRALFQYRYNPS